VICWKASIKKCESDVSTDANRLGCVGASGCNSVEEEEVKTTTSVVEIHKRKTVNQLRPEATGES